MPITRFVILHHRERSGEHWDLMIEQAAGLATWRLARLPAAGDSAPIAAEKLVDHRKAYLAYEGPVSRDRGEVQRVDAGACEILEQTNDCWRIDLQGQRLFGRFAMRRCAGVCDDQSGGHAQPIGFYTGQDRWLVVRE